VKSISGTIIYDMLAMSNGGFSAKNNDDSVLAIVDSPFDMYGAY
jgi:hypothetical protein